MSKYCNGCSFLNIEEDEQDLIKKERKVIIPHICLKYGVQVRHFPYKEPYIHPYRKCTKEEK